MTKKAYEIAVEQERTSGITEGSSKEATSKITGEQKNKEAIIARFNQIDYSKELSLEDWRTIKNNLPLYFATVSEENLAKSTSQLQKELRKDLPNENLPDDEFARIAVRHAQAEAKGQNITLSPNETKKLNEIYNEKGGEYLKNWGYTRNENGEYEIDPQQVQKMGSEYYEFMVDVEICIKSNKEKGNLKEGLKNICSRHSDVLNLWGISEEAFYAKAQEEEFSIRVEQVKAEYGIEEEIPDDDIFADLDADQITQDKPEEQPEQPSPAEQDEQKKTKRQEPSKPTVGKPRNTEEMAVQSDEIEDVVEQIFNDEKKTVKFKGITVLKTALLQVIGSVGILEGFNKRMQESFAPRDAVPTDQIASEEMESEGQVPPTVDEANRETQQASTQTPANEINQDGPAQETTVTGQPAPEEVESQATEVTQSQEADYASPILNVEEKKGLGKLFDNIKGLVAKGAKRLRGDKQAQLPDGTQRISEDVKYEEKSGKPLTGKDMVELGFTGKGFRAMANRAINTLGQIITSPFVKNNPPEPNQTLTPSTPANDFDTRYAVDVTQENGTAYTIPEAVSSEPKQKPKEEDIDERY